MSVFFHVQNMQNQNLCSESDGPRPFARTAPVREPQLSLGIWHKMYWVLRLIETAEKWVFLSASNIFEHHIWVNTWLDLIRGDQQGGQGCFLAIRHHHLGFNATQTGRMLVIIDHFRPTPAVFPARNSWVRVACCLSFTLGWVLLHHLSRTCNSSKKNHCKKVTLLKALQTSTKPTLLWSSSTSHQRLVGVFVEHFGSSPGILKQA